MTTSYGSSVTASPSSVNGNVTTPVSGIVAGLQPLTTYHFRARGVRTDGLAIYGNDLTFTTGVGIPVNITATGTISGDTCINATQVITVGGTPNTFVVTPTANVTMIAGQKIGFLPGSTVQAGAYLHGYITTNGQYCTTQTRPMVVAGEQEITEKEPTQAGAFGKKMQIRVFPNPVSTSFKLTVAGMEDNSSAKMELYNMNGLKILSEELTGKSGRIFDISALPAGLYLVKVICGENVEMVKVVKW